MVSGLVEYNNANIDIDKSDKSLVEAYPILVPPNMVNIILGTIKSLKHGIIFYYFFRRIFTRQLHCNVLVNIYLFTTNR